MAKISTIRIPSKLLSHATLIIKKNKKGVKTCFNKPNAEERTRTSTGLPPLGPKPSVSTSFTTSAQRCAPCKLQWTPPYYPSAKKLAKEKAHDMISQ